MGTAVGYWLLAVSNFCFCLRLRSGSAITKFPLHDDLLARHNTSKLGSALAALRHYKVSTSR